MSELWPVISELHPLRKYIGPWRPCFFKKSSLTTQPTDVLDNAAHLPIYSTLSQKMVPTFLGLDAENKIN